jgi:hypothetical protein
MRAGMPLRLLYMGLCNDDEVYVEKLLLESPAFKHGLVSIQETWLDVMLCGGEVTLLLAPAPHYSCQVPGVHLFHIYLATS